MALRSILSNFRQNRSYPRDFSAVWSFLSFFVRPFVRSFVRSFVTFVSAVRSSIWSKRWGPVRRRLRPGGAPAFRSNAKPKHVFRFLAACCAPPPKIEKNEKRKHCFRFLAACCAPPPKIEKNAKRKGFFNHIQKDFLINVWGYLKLKLFEIVCRWIKRRSNSSNVDDSWTE